MKAAVAPSEFQGLRMRLETSKRLGASDMSMRDWFAGHMINQIDLDLADRIAAPEQPAWDEVSDDGYGDEEYTVPRAEIARRMATTAYFLADAMLKAREAK